MASAGAGVPDSRVPLPDLDAFREACDRLLPEARRTLRILAPELDLALLNREPVASEVARLARSSRLSDIRILFADSLPAVRHGHRLIELARRFPSFIALRLLPDDARDREPAWMVVDERALLWRASHRRYSHGYLAMENVTAAPSLCRDFDDWWERARPDPELRQLYL